MSKKTPIRIEENGEFVWGGLMSESAITRLVESADNLSDELPPEPQEPEWEVTIGLNRTKNFDRTIHIDLNTGSVQERAIKEAIEALMEYVYGERPFYGDNHGGGDGIEDVADKARTLVQKGKS